MFGVGGGLEKFYECVPTQRAKLGADLRQKQGAAPRHKDGHKVTAARQNASGGEGVGHSFHQSEGATYIKNLVIPQQLQAVGSIDPDRLVRGAAFRVDSGGLLRILPVEDIIWAWLLETNAIFRRCLIIVQPLPDLFERDTSIW